MLISVGFARQKAASLVGTNARQTPSASTTGCDQPDHGFKCGMRIVVLPGLDGTGLLLTEFEESLSRHHAVSVMRYPPDMCRYDELHRWLESQLPGEPFVIVAESFSGPLAAMIASQAPNGLMGVVFVATFARSPLALPPFVARAMTVMPIRSAALVTMLQPLVMGRWANRSFTLRFQAAMHMVAGETMSKRLHEVLTVDARDLLRNMSLPFLYLRATQDRLVPRRASEDFDLPHGSIIDLEGLHFLLQANPRQAFEAVMTFAAGLP